MVNILSFRLSSICFLVVGDKVIFGVDYYEADGETISYLIVEADTLESATIDAGKLLNDMGLPRRNILYIEELNWLNR